MNNIFSTLASAVSSIAPTLATMLGGPLAGAAVSALEGALGLAPGAGADAVADVLKNGKLTADQIVAVQAANQRHTEIIGQQGLDLAKLNAAHSEAFAADDVADRVSARARQVSLRDWTTPVLAWLVMTGSIALAAAVVTGNVTKDPTLAVQVGVVIGYVFNEAKAVLSFYFGSSRGSDEKSRDLAEIAKSS